MTEAEGVLFSRESRIPRASADTWPLVGGVAKDRWPKGRSCSCSDALQVAHAWHFF